MVTKLTPQDIRRYNGYIWKFFGGCFALLVLLIAATYLGVFGELPSFRDLENPKSEPGNRELYRQISRFWVLTISKTGRA